MWKPQIPEYSSELAAPWQNTISCNTWQIRVLWQPHWNLIHLLYTAHLLMIHNKAKSLPRAPHLWWVCMAQGALSCPSSCNVFWRIHDFATLKRKYTTRTVSYILVSKKGQLEKRTQPISPFWVALAMMAMSVLLARSGWEMSCGPDAKQQSLACHQTGWLHAKPVLPWKDHDHPLLFTRQCWNQAGTQRLLGCCAIRWQSDCRSSHLNLTEAWREREKSMGTGNMGHDMIQAGSQEKTYYCC